MLKLPDCGQITLEHTFYILDGEPILFVCVSNTGIRYLCSCCKLYEEWVICKVSLSSLVDMIDDKVTIREVFESRDGPKFFVTRNGDKFEVTNNLPYDALPREGTLLELEQEKTGPYRAAL